MCLSRELGNLANRNFEVLLKLDRMNRALRVYWQAMSEDEGQVADVVFADCYDWLVARSVSIYYDEKPKLWMLRLYLTERKTHMPLGYGLKRVLVWGRGNGVSGFLALNENRYIVSRAESHSAAQCSRGRIYRRAGIRNVTPVEDRVRANLYGNQGSQAPRKQETLSS